MLFKIFIAAVCVVSLIKLRWRKCLLCVSLDTPSEKRIFYHYVNLLLLLMASTLFVTLHLRTGTLYLIMQDLSLLYQILEGS